MAGLIVGRRAIGVRLGYERGKMRRPVPGQLLASWRHYDGRYVMEPHPHVEPDHILLSGSSNDLPQPEPSR